MKPTLLVPVLASLLLFAPLVRAADTFDEAMKGVFADYTERIRKASEELNIERARLAKEKAPLLEKIRAAENRIIKAESEQIRLQTGVEQAAEQRQKALKELDLLRRTTTYVNTLARDSLKALKDGLAPGEDQFLSDRLLAITQRLEDISGNPSAQLSLEAAELMLERTERAIGGYVIPGTSMVAETRQVVKGTFAFAGPETYFRAGDGSTAGTVRSREGVTYPVTYQLPLWKAEDATAFFDGRAGTMIADASGGKALRLQETKGSLWGHIKKGGLVAYAIVIVGVFSLGMILHKLRDLSRMKVDSPETVRKVLAAISSGSITEAEQGVAAMKASTRDLFTVGLRHMHEPKAALEEHLQAMLLQERLHFERRLPLLAVIATASPLMGLLGTVVGMVKTFALITVFGTGNAGKLSSGISEVLVATELGLVVAIPTLVAHGFLAHRIQKNLSLLERYALQFVTAADRTPARVGKHSGEAAVGV